MQIEQIVKQLEEERAIQALVGVRSVSFLTRVQTKSVSPATRRKIAAAQKSRWAKRVSPSAGATLPKRTISAAGRRKIAAAQRARWAKVKAKKH